MPVLQLKVKARSAVDLSRAGIYRYFEPSAEVQCAAWAFGDGPATVWFPERSCPKEIADHVESDGAITSWGIFERLSWERILGPRHGWPVPKPEQFHDTMAAAAALSLPRIVESAANRRRAFALFTRDQQFATSIPSVPYCSHMFERK